MEEYIVSCICLLLLIVSVVYDFYASKKSKTKNLFVFLSFFISGIYFHLFLQQVSNSEPTVNIVTSLVVMASQFASGLIKVSIYFNLMKKFELSQINVIDNFSEHIEVIEDLKDCNGEPQFDDSFIDMLRSWNE